MKIPKTLGACADLYYTTREKRLKAQKVVDELKAQENQLADHIIKNLPKSDANGIAGKKCRVTIREKTIPQVQDWDAFYEYIRKNAKKGAFSLLQKRVGDAAVKEIWEAGKEVPGVGRFHVKTLSVNKL